MEEATTRPRVGKEERRRRPSFLPGRFWRRSAPGYVNCLTWGYAPKPPNNAARNIAAPRRLVRLTCAGNPIQRPSAARQYQLNLDCDTRTLFVSISLRFTDVCCISELIKPRAPGRARKSPPPPDSALKFPSSGLCSQVPPPRSWPPSISPRQRSRWTTRTSPRGRRG